MPVRDGYSAAVHPMDILRSRLASQFSDSRESIGELLRVNGEFVIDSVRIAQVFGGMRGIHGLVCDTSSVDPTDGLIIRGRGIHALKSCSPEEVFWLLLTGELPEYDELLAFRQDLLLRRRLPDWMDGFLAAMPAGSHPMSMFNAAVLAMQGQSHFAGAYHSTPKSELWQPALEDALDLFATMPLLAVRVYRQRYGLVDKPGSADADYISQLASGLLGREDSDFESLLRRYVVVQSDHENGNVCALSAHVTGSTHADLYFAVSAGLNGLAGHIHGLAAQDFIRFLHSLQDELGSEPAEESIRQAMQQRLDSGRVLPGFGHAVLRQADPRFEILYAIAAERYGDHPLFTLASRVYSIGTELLKAHGRVKNPYPNVDAVTGVVLQLAGVEQLEFYTVLFGVSLSIGILAQNVVSRGIGSPIVRPRSVATAELRGLAGG